MWILFALVSAFIYAAASMVSKYSVSKVVRNQNGIVVIHAAAAMVAITAIWLLSGRPGLANAHDTVLALIAGALIGAAAIFYFKAFNMEDMSLVTLLTQITVPMALIGSAIFLHDRITTGQLVAVIVILCGVVFATWGRKGFHLHSTKIIPIILIATALTAALTLISKSVIGHSNVIAFQFYEEIGYLIFGILLTVFHRPNREGFMRNMRPFYPMMLLVIFGAEILYTLALLSQLQSLTYANAGLVFSVLASEVFFSILLGAALTKFFPHIISEKVDKKTISRKVVAGVLIVSGIVMLNFVS